MKKLLLSTWIFFIFVAADASVEIVLDNPLDNITYHDSFRIENLDYQTGNPSIDVLISYNLTQNNSTIIFENITKTINKYTRTKTSNITFFNNLTQKLCVKIKTENDNNIINNYQCKYFFAPEEIINQTINNSLNNTLNNTINNTINRSVNGNRSNNLTENQENECDIFFELMKPEIFDDKAKLMFDINTDEHFELTYWIEDISGNIVKQKLTTSNDNDKTFTPKTSGAYKLKSELKINNCELINKETFFVVTKKSESYLTSEIKKENPLIFEFELNSKEYFEEGINIKIGEIIIGADQLAGIQNFKINYGEFCGDKEIIITSKDLEESHYISSEACETEKKINPEIESLITHNNLVSSIFLPEKEEIEIYLRKNGRKTGTSEFIEGEGIIQKTWLLEDSGNYEVIGKIGSQLLSSSQSYEEKEEEKTPETTGIYRNTPLITGNSVSETKTENYSIFGFIIIILLLIGDKFKKYRRSSNKHEQKRRKISSRKRPNSLQNNASSGRNS